MSDPAETGSVARWRVEELSAEAAEAGDLAMVSICEEALDGSPAALESVADVLADARAQEDES